MERPETTARHRAYMPEGSSEILNTRSLRTAHRRLGEILQPGLTVLDVGCGSGAITRGMAEAVAPNGRVVGIDVNSRLIEEARRTHGDVPGLSFEVCDVQGLPLQDRFDVVTAARVLQWLANPLAALQNMAASFKPGGQMVVLDYNHEKILWKPPLPATMQTFYDAFLCWRAEAGMDNAIADHLPGMFVTIGGPSHQQHLSAIRWYGHEDAADHRGRRLHLPVKRRSATRVFLRRHPADVGVWQQSLDGAVSAWLSGGG